MRRFALALLAIAAATIALGGAAAFGTRAAVVFTVDDDGVQCPSPDFNTIQDAVNAASSGDTINVCAGDYATTSIPAAKPGLTLNGARYIAEGDRTLLDNRCRLRGFGEDPTKDAIVHGQTGPGYNPPAVTVDADNTTIRGFTIKGTENSAGMYTTPSTSGDLIRQNVFLQNTFGLYSNSSGATTTTISFNCFADNNVSGPASGNGIYSDQGFANALITLNYFTLNQNASIVITFFQPPQPSNITILKNKSQSNSGMALIGVQNSSVLQNRIFDASSSGIFLEGTSGVNVRSNQVIRCLFTGVNLRNVFGTGPNVGAVVRSNTVKNCGDNGIGVRDGSNGNTIQRNKVSGNGLQGILLEDGDGNLVQGNSSTGNSQDGVRADANSTGNFIRSNTALGNAAIDCHDLSSGGGTGGTANSWTNDIGNTSSPPGLCVPPPAGGAGADADVGANEADLP